MPSFFLGFFCAITITILVFVILTFFRAGIEQRIKVIEKEIAIKGPKPKGHIFLPDDDVTRSRKEIIKENKKLGKDTKLSDLF